MALLLEELTGGALLEELDPEELYLQSRRDDHTTRLQELSSCGLLVGRRASHFAASPRADLAGGHPRG